MASSPDRPFDNDLHAASAAPPRAETASREQRQAEDELGSWIRGSPGKLAQGAIFGVIFGFLLQKGGVAKFDILVGVLLLEEFTVVKVMLSAIVVGMAGVYFLRRLGVLETQIKETVLGSNLIGGLLFGVGFAMIAYCPGTNAAAVGQGNLDALVGIFGLVFGSYLFALASKHTRGTVSKWGQMGKVTLADLVKLPTGAAVAIIVPLLVAVLVLLEIFDGR
jgi:uncharacterized protein